MSKLFERLESKNLLVIRRGDRQDLAEFLESKGLSIRLTDRTSGEPLGKRGWGAFLGHHESEVSTEEHVFDCESAEEAVVLFVFGGHGFRGLSGNHFRLTNIYGKSLSISCPHFLEE